MGHNKPTQRVSLGGRTEQLVDENDFAHHAWTLQDAVAAMDRAGTRAAGILLCPVRHLMLLSGDAVTASSIGVEGHGGNPGSGKGDLPALHLPPGAKWRTVAKCICKGNDVLG
jgi:hypothetical protein